MDIRAISIRRLLNSKTIVMRIGLVDVDGHNFPNHSADETFGMAQAPGAIRWSSPIPRRSVTTKSICRRSLPFLGIAPTVTIARSCVPGRVTGTMRRFFPKRSNIYAPDYSLYGGQKEAYGFRRGCVNRCFPWCVVPHKEGEVRAHADIEEFLDGRKHAVLLDNNVLASEWGTYADREDRPHGHPVDFQPRARCPAYRPHTGDLPLARTGQMDTVSAHGLRQPCHGTTFIKP